jgi:hypothetical protein
LTAEELTREERHDAAVREVRERMPNLALERARLRRARIEPTRVLLPARLKVDDEGATCLGLPVVWTEGEVWGFAVTLPEPRHNPDRPGVLKPEWFQG